MQVIHLHGSSLHATHAHDSISSTTAQHSSAKDVCRHVQNQKFRLHAHAPRDISHSRLRAFSRIKILISRARSYIQDKLDDMLPISAIDRLSLRCMDKKRSPFAGR